MNKELLLFAKELSTTWWLDILDCSKSFVRQKLDVSWDEALRLCQNGRFTMIERPGYLEVGLSTLGDPSYYLWIHVHGDNIAKLYNETSE